MEGQSFMNWEDSNSSDSTLMRAADLVETNLEFEDVMDEIVSANLLTDSQFSTLLTVEPGRVVTLARSDDPEDEVWGVACKISQEQESMVCEQLDFREKGGYEKTNVTFYPLENTVSPFELDIYIGSKDNPYYLGPASIKDIARQICSSQGPSGHNVEYLLQLAEAMKIIAPGINDKHLFELEAEVNSLSTSNECRSSCNGTRC